MNNGLTQLELRFVRYLAWQIIGLVVWLMFSLLSTPHGVLIAMVSGWPLMAFLFKVRWDADKPPARHEVWAEAAAQMLLAFALVVLCEYLGIAGWGLNIVIIILLMPAVLSVLALWFGWLSKRLS